MSNQNFLSIIAKLNPNAIVLSNKAEYGSYHGETYRIQQLENVLNEAYPDLFGTGAACEDIFEAWDKVACPFTWSQAISLMIVADTLGDLNYVTKNTVMTTWMQLLATQGKCLNRTIARRALTA